MAQPMPGGFFELDEHTLSAHLVGALNTQTICLRLGALVYHLADIARPGAGGAKILLVVARLAAALGEPVEVRIYQDGDGSVLDTILVGDESWRRPWETVHLAVPFTEFDQAVRIHPELVAPLLVAGGMDGFVLLLRSRGNREVFAASTVQMPALSIPPRRAHRA